MWAGASAMNEARRQSSWGEGVTEALRPQEVSSLPGTARRPLLPEQSMEGEEKPGRLAVTSSLA